MLTKKKIIIASLIAIIIIGVAGVGVWQQFHQPEKAIVGSMGVIDDLGRNITITKYPPERIVSLAPSCTEILFALELGSKVVGVDELSDYPPEVQERIEAGNLTMVGSFARISIETVVGLEPDLVLATGGTQSPIVEELEGLGLVVVALLPKNVDDILSNILLVGKITGQMDAAKVLVADMNQIIIDIANKTKQAHRPRVYTEFYFTEAGHRTYGKDSFVNELIYYAGGINMFAEFGGYHFLTSDEVVIAADPEIIIVVMGVMAESCGLSLDQIRSRSAWQSVDAVEHDRIYEIDGVFLTRAGPRIIDGLQKLAQCIHPELFK